AGGVYRVIMAKLGLYQRTVLAYPRVTLALVILAVASVAAWITDFRLDASADSLVLESDDDLRFAGVVARRYGQEEFLIVAYDPGRDILSPQSIERLRKLRDDLKKLPGVASIQSLLDVPLLSNPPVAIEDLKDNLKTLEDPKADIDLARKELQSSVLFQELLVNRDLSSTAIQISLETNDEYERLSRRRSELRDMRFSSAGLSPQEVEELRQVEEQFDASKTAVLGMRHELVREVRSLLEKHRKEDAGSTQFYLGGVPMIVDDLISFIESDLRIFAVGVCLFLIVTLGLLFRRLRWVLLPMSCCIVSTSAMMGLLGLFGWEVTVVSSNFVSLQLIFTMSLTIHIVVRYRELLRSRGDEDGLTLVRETVRLTFVPCLYAYLTTMAGFTSLVFCDIRPVESFGLMMSLGLVVSFILTFILLPATLALLPKPKASREHDVAMPLLRWFARLTEKRGGFVIGTSLALAVATGIGMTRLEVENSFVDYFKESTEIYQGMEFIDRQLGGTTPLDVIIEFGDKGVETADDSGTPAIEPTPEGDATPQDEPEVATEESTDGGDDDFSEFDEFDEFDEVSEEDREKYWFTTTKLERIEKVHDYLESIPEIGKVLSLATLFKLGRELNDGADLDDLIIAILFQQMPEDFRGVLVQPYASIENDQARISVRIRDSEKGLRRDDLLRRIRRDLGEKIGLEPTEYRLSGLMVLYNNMLQSLFRSQFQTIGYTVGILFLMFLLLLGSVKVSIIALLPNLLAAGAILGIMGLAGIPLDVMTITIVAISVGISVDDTIHYLHRFRHELEIDGDYVAAMQRSHESIGNAMFYTSITITAGFSILALSNFIPSILFGLLTSLAMVLALICALTLLPRLLLVFKPYPTKSPAGSD
ncbi:MAG: MMPL family transporter, partial [Planctomycetota bacterium]